MGVLGLTYGLALLARGTLSDCHLHTSARSETREVQVVTLGFRCARVCWHLVIFFRCSPKGLRPCVLLFLDNPVPDVRPKAAQAKHRLLRSLEL